MFSDNSLGSLREESWDWSVVVVVTVYAEFFWLSGSCAKHRQKFLSKCCLWSWITQPHSCFADVHGPVLILTIRALCRSHLFMFCRMLKIATFHLWLLNSWTDCRNMLLVWAVVFQNWLEIEFIPVEEMINIFIDRRFWLSTYHLLLGTSSNKHRRLIMFSWDFS